MLVEAVVALLLDHGPMTVEAEAKQLQRLLSRDAATAKRLRVALEKRNALPAGTRSAAVADACPEAAALWVARRTWTPGAVPPSTDDEQAVAYGLAVAARLEQEAAEHERQRIEDEQPEEPEAEPPPPAWVDELGAELAEAWRNTRPPTGDQLRAGNGPALIELRKGLYARGRLAIGSAPLPLLERAVRRAFELVDARQAAAVEVAA